MLAAGARSVRMARDVELRLVVSLSLDGRLLNNGRHAANITVTAVCSRLSSIHVLITTSSSSSPAQCLNMSVVTPSGRSYQAIWAALRELYDGSMIAQVSCCCRIVC